MVESIGRMGFTIDLNPGVATPPPVGRHPCPGKDRDGSNATCSSASSAMSSGRLLVDRGARQHCPSPLPRLRGILRSVQQASRHPNLFKNYIRPLEETAIMISILLWDV